jgi:hypothetical protein
MTCDRASQLVDGYLEGLLGPRERRRLEQHLSDCPCCTEELRARLAFEHRLQQALAAAVHNLEMAPDASRRLIQAVEAGLVVSDWRWSAMRVARLVAGALAAVLLVIGLFLLVNRAPLPPSVRQAVLSPGSQPALSVDQADISFEPYGMAPGDRFTITVPIRSDNLQGVDAIRCNLDINGPTGRYQFALFLQGPLPEYGLSVLQVTPDLLAAPCQAQYHVSPSEIFGQEGAYALRVTVFSPSAAPTE